MSCTTSEAVHFWTYAPRLSFGNVHFWSIGSQIEAFDELDTLAAVTLDDGMRQRCLSVLTTRPDIAILSKLGCEPDGEQFLALFDDEYLEGPKPGKHPTADVYAISSDMPRHRSTDGYAWTSSGMIAALLAEMPPLPWAESCVDPACGSGAPLFDGNRLVGVFFR